MPQIDSLDHLVLTVAELDQTIRFYCDVLGMEAKQFQPADGSTRWALTFGSQKINLHPAAGPYEPKANTPLPGSTDICFLSSTNLADWASHLAQHNVGVEEGPVARTGATGPVNSIYIRDPDGNLIEIANAV